MGQSQGQGMPTPQPGASPPAQGAAKGGPQGAAPAPGQMPQPGAPAPAGGGPIPDNMKNQMMAQALRNLAQPAYQNRAQPQSQSVPVQMVNGQAAGPVSAQRPIMR